MITVGSKICVKDNSVFPEGVKIGDVFEVKEITESYIKASCTWGFCVLSMDELDKYFTKENIYKKEGRDSEWSEWKNFHLDGIGINIQVLYKTKYGKTHVLVYNAYYDKWYSGRSSAHWSDVQNLTSGIYVAFGRAVSKMGYDSGISTYEMLKDNPSVVNVFKKYYKLPELPKNWNNNYMFFMEDLM